ncbi:GAF domain-containing protein [Dictyobacter formicarum]|uniref:GAF domain-containing protein n=1 Tax=Dictyobacter formicarum TaxID=2778368 RepID=A0ABQ3VSU5_9CHLR|nr:GAF domain-containing protein [Dictyobacter formicarum]GHO88774.1 hypothetical protein KSZ_67800 [Dictyobacter formicarum]
MEMTWRELLRNIASDPLEQQKILDSLNINAMTLKRWINGETNPRPQNLRLLLNALPQHRKQLLLLLTMEFPFLSQEISLQEEQNALIPTAFYEQVMSTYVGVSQHMRSATVSSLILQQILKHLDPDLNGMLVYVAQCVPPAKGQKVRSLRMMSGNGTAPWSTYVEYHPQFFGAESLVGYAVSSGHLTALQTQDEIQRIFPYDQIDDVRSAAASPILLANQTVGAIYIASTQVDFFSHAHLSLIQKYVELMCLAFDKNEFYLLSDISLGVMPLREQQLPVLITFQSHVTQQIVLAARENRTLTRLQAEKIAWQELEEKLFHHMK